MPSPSILTTTTQADFTRQQLYSYQNLKNRALYPEGRLADGFANLLRSIWGNEFRIVKPHEARVWKMGLGYPICSMSGHLKELGFGCPHGLKRLWTLRLDKCWGWSLLAA